MAKKKKYWVIIPAAGAGTRMGVDIPKQYLEINGKTVLEYTITRFIDLPVIEGIVVALAKDDTIWPEMRIAGHHKVRSTIGGKERYHSVLNGLNYLESFADTNDWVLVHDAARPCLRRNDIERLIDELAEHPVGGLLASPARDTMKRGMGDDEVDSTVERRDLWHALTPQMFRLNDLQIAIRKTIEEDMVITDEAQAIEYTGVRPKLVRGYPDNIKITHKNDLALAELFLKQQEEEE